MTRAEPVISSTVSPFMRSAVIYAAIWASVASPCMISRITASASASVRCVPVTTLDIISLIIVCVLVSDFQEVPQQVLARSGQDGLGMELDAFHLELLVPHAHDDAV